MDANTLSPASGADQIAALRAELDQRDATIDLLARQLEEAANRLDWISRCGSDVEPQPSSSKSEGHSGHGPLQGDTSDRLNQFLQQWEQIELGESLERIDRRLSHVFEALKSFESGSQTSPRSSGSTSSRHTEPPAEVPTGSLLTAFLKSQSADGSGGKQHTDESPRASIASAAPATNSHEASAPHDVCFLPLPDFVVPEPIDVQTADVDALRKAIIAREDCVQQLIARARIAEANRTNSPDWKSLESIPEELHKHLLQLEIDLRQTIRQEELSSSIERAKISRDRAHLDQVRKELETQIRRLGIAQKPAETESGDENKPGGKRWGKVFGR